MIEQHAINELGLYNQTQHQNNGHPKKQSYRLWSGADVQCTLHIATWYIYPYHNINNHINNWNIQLKPSKKE